jgi:16S rRNA (uracil1498-N3)-methyltransferase
MKRSLKLGVALELGGEFDLEYSSAAWVFEFGPRPGSILSLEGNDDRWFRARALSIGKDSLRVKVFEEMPRSPESDLFMVLLQAVPNRERMELIIEKAVELGVDVIQPFFSKRSYRFEDLPQPKWRRWQDRALKASVQCRRGKVVKVLEPRKLEQALEVSTATELGMVLYEKERGRGLVELLEQHKAAKSCTLISGPEGGFEQSEVDWLTSLGIVPVSMGGRILRAETSSIIGVGVVQFYLGDLGGSKR